ncbi:hypothetical protein PHYBOEH_006114 [Phytophthora boehmeriae]|uniref:Uncharacterized protein n=1 Tax=Phytophthora boehmeriae TaxID=109152 RepID=A0A8T1X2N8_9STRA|nr:hypothetical protein PHYBOEH_006114 [Phytophthora boehmeriae]
MTKDAATQLVQDDDGHVADGVSALTRAPTQGPSRHNEVAKEGQASTTQSAAKEVEDVVKAVPPSSELSAQPATQIAESGGRYANEEADAILATQLARDDDDDGEGSQMTSKQHVAQGVQEVEANGEDKDAATNKPAAPTTDVAKTTAKSEEQWMSFSLGKAAKAKTKQVTKKTTKKTVKKMQTPKSLKAKTLNSKGKQVLSPKGKVQSKGKMRSPGLKKRRPADEDRDLSIKKAHRLFSPHEMCDSSNNDSDDDLPSHLMHLNDREKAPGDRGSEIKADKDAIIAAHVPVFNELPAIPKKNYASWESFDSALSQYCDEHNVHFRVRSSKPVDGFYNS